MKKATKSDLKYIARINETAIDPNDMEKILRAMGDRPREDQSLELSVGVASQELPNKSSDYLLAIIFRLQALAQSLKDNPDIPGIAKSGSQPGQVMIPKWTVAAACNCNLIAGSNNHVEFDSEEFRTKAVSAAKPEGHA